MPTTFALLPQATNLDTIPRGEVTRLVACPRCGSRHRILDEVEGRLVGRCLDCGTTLALPLATERQRGVTLVGRRQRGRPIAVDPGD